MITRRYLLSTTSSRSSMGGLVMPSAVVIPATGFLPSLRASWRKAVSGRHQGYQLLAHFLDRRVHQRDIELPAGFHLLPCHIQAALDHVRWLGPPAGEPAGQFLAGRGGEEDQQRAGNAPAHLPGPRNVDLEQSRHPGSSPFVDGGFRGAVLLAGERCPLQQLAAGNHRVKSLITDEMVFAPVHLTGPRRPRSNGNRQPDIRALCPQARDDGALAYAGRTGKDRQPDFTGRPWGKRGDLGSTADSPVHRLSDAALAPGANRPWNRVPRACPWGRQARSDITAELVLQRGALI